MSKQSSKPPAVAYWYDKLIMVVSRGALFAGGAFEGFAPKDAADYESRILEHCTFMKRGLAETDPAHKQPIAYIIIVNPRTKKVFAYQRASHDAKYSEKRLQGKWSFGIGGHIDKVDAADGNPIHASMLRELEEEVEIAIAGVRVLGYINSDSDDVGKVHFGILYVAETSSEVKPKAGEISSGKMVTLRHLEKICSSRNVEEWSRIALEPLKSYLHQARSK